MIEVSQQVIFRLRAVYGFSCATMVITAIFEGIVIKLLNPLENKQLTSSAVLVAMKFYRATSGSASKDGTKLSDSTRRNVMIFLLRLILFSAYRMVSLGYAILIIRTKSRN